MKFLVTLDRFERAEDQMGIAFLLMENGYQLEWPGWDLLPYGIKPGDKMWFEVSLVPSEVDRAILPAGSPPEPTES